VTAARARWPDTSRATLEQGRSLYVRRCSGCHNLYVPSDYPASAWPEIVEEMSEKAKLDRDERDQVLRYLIVASDTR
jgi:hypothetical protein